MTVPGRQATVRRQTWQRMTSSRGNGHRETARRRLAHLPYDARPATVIMPGCSRHKHATRQMSVLRLRIMLRHNVVIRTNENVARAPPPRVLRPLTHSVIQQIRTSRRFRNNLRMQAQADLGVRELIHQLRHRGHA